MQEYEVRPIPYDEVREWLLFKHYAHRIPSISFAFGLYNKELRMVGVCTYGVPASPSLVSGAISEEYADKFFELNRLVVDDGLPRNTLSFFVATTLKMLPRPMVVVSYADSEQGHHGYIYQATNWLYTGMTKPHSEYSVDGGENKHSRHLLDEYGGINEAKAKGVKMNVGQRSIKYRYFQFLGDKRQKRDMLRKFKYEILNEYPKGDNKRYDASYKPSPQGLLF